MARVKARDRIAHRKIEELFRVLERSADFGYPLRDPWTGYQAVHVAQDRYRVIWREFPPESDYTGGDGDEVVPVVVVRVGPKTDAQHRSIYDEPPPADLGDRS